MNRDNYMKMIRPRVVVRALAALDKQSMVIITVVWFVALTMMLIAIYEVRSAATLSQDLDQALMQQPIFNAPVETEVTDERLKFIANLMQKQFPELKLASDQNRITISGDSAVKFHTWVNAVSILEAMAPEISWQIDRLCVGDGCEGQSKVYARIQGKIRQYTLPQPKEG